VGIFAVKFWNGDSEVSGRTTTLPEGTKLGAEKVVGMETEVGMFAVKFWNGESEVSGKTTTLPEGTNVGIEKEVGAEKDVGTEIEVGISVTFWNGESVNPPEGRIVPAEKVGRVVKGVGSEKFEGVELEEEDELDDSLGEAIERTTLTNSVGPENRWEVTVAPSLVGPVGVRPAEKEPAASPPVGCSAACELSLG
jgi:hypothetical protein